MLNDVTRKPTSVILLSTRGRRAKTSWPAWGSNPRPSRYQHDALTNWANGPRWKSWLVKFPPELETNTECCNPIHYTMNATHLVYNTYSKPMYINVVLPKYFTSPTKYPPSVRMEIWLMQLKVIKSHWLTIGAFHSYKCYTFVAYRRLHRWIDTAV